MIYLDYAANTPVAPAVLETFCRAEEAFIGNPNAAHCAGQAAREELARVTGRIAQLLGTDAGGILYTSGATESNNLAIKGIAQAAEPRGRHILSTPLEHPSVSGSLEALQRQGWQVELLGLDRDGRVDPAELRARIWPDTVLAAVCAVDSELGIIQPLEQIAAAVKEHPSCRLHVDATQAVGKTPLVLAGADTVSLAPHKFYGLNGSGLLLKRSGLQLATQLHGGAGVTVYRSGTPTLALAAAAETALRLTVEQQERRNARVREMNRQLRAELRQYPAVRINSPEGAVPHILNLSVEGVKGTVFQRMLSGRGVCVSVRSACATAGAPSKAVLAVTGDRRNALSSWRISLSHLTTAEELADFLQIFRDCYRELVR